LKTTWRSTKDLKKDVDAAENLEIRLQELTNILADESRRPLPHPCISFCATKQIYVPIAKIATTSYNEWIIKEAVLFFATLIESEEEAFVENDAFSASLTNLLVRITGPNSIRLGLDTEVRVVEVAFNITTKIRLDPSILPTWFKSRHDDETSEEQSRDGREKFAGKTQKQDFPLFYLLMEYIHSEGKVGDFARTGLLYIIESASSSVALEQWIVESDLSTLMATGLGALYSQLSRKLVIDHPPQDVPPVLAFSDYQHPTSTFEIVSSCSPDFQLHLETFLSHLLFWQDVLNHCRSVEVKSTLLEHFQVIFLQQLLYPSLLESSDVDGGSSVAVLTYLRRILESLEHPDMINLILHYLLALPDASLSLKSPGEPVISAARKRKSMDLATLMAETSDPAYTPLLFNLVDLIKSGLRSRNEQTVSVTLQLLAAILKRHHRYAVITLLRTEPVLRPGSNRTRGAHEQELEFLTTLASSIGGQENFDELYDGILKDTMIRVEGHPCSLKLIAPRVSTNNHKLPAVPDSLPGAPRDVPNHTLSPEDPVFGIVIDILETFLINSVETNLALTEALIDLAVCGYISVEGWFLRNPRAYVFNEEKERLVPTEQEDSEATDAITAEAKKIRAVEKCRLRPEWTTGSLPRFLQVLDGLTRQVESYRTTIPRFEDLVQQRREAFQTADAIRSNPTHPPRTSSNTATPGLERTSLDESRTASPARPGGIEGFAQRLFSEFGTPSRSASPRGRKETSRGPYTPSSGLASTLGFASPSAKSITAAPKEFPLNLENPGLSGLGRSMSPGSHQGKDVSSFGDSSSPGHVASQMAAFAAVDQSILARRVALPGSDTEKIAPIPLDFHKRPVNGVSKGADEAKEVDTEASDNTELNHEDAERVDEQADRDEGDQDASVQANAQTSSVSHIITNVIVLQNFLLELAALVQVRASVFDEVRFA
jgi:hypothetical protein